MSLTSRFGSKDGTILSFEDTENYMTTSKDWIRQSKRLLFGLNYLTPQEINWFFKKIRRQEELTVDFEDLHYEYWDKESTMEYNANKEDYERCIPIVKEMKKIKSNIEKCGRKLAFSHDSIRSYYSLLMAREILRSDYRPKNLREGGKHVY